MAAAPAPVPTRRAALAALLALAGCGYGFTAGVGRLPPGAESVLVRPLDNRTADAEVGALLAAAGRGRRRGRRGAPGGDRAAERRLAGVARRGHLAPVPGGGGAPARRRAGAGRGAGAAPGG